MLRNIIEDLKPHAGQVNVQHVRSIFDLAERGENGKSLPLPGGIEVRRENDALVFRVLLSRRAKFGCYGVRLFGPPASQDFTRNHSADPVPSTPLPLHSD